MGSIIITGAASGIGAAVARQLARQGHELVLHTGHNQAGIEAMAAECRALGAARTVWVVGDMAAPQTVTQLMAAAAPLQPLAGVVANAGFADRSPLAELDAAALERSWQAMPAALARLLQASLPQLAASVAAGGPGRFVAISSFVAHRFTLASSCFAATAAAKAAIEALVKAAAVEAAASGVTVNAVAPGYVQKDQGGQGRPRTALSSTQWQQAAERIPLRRLAQPDDIAGPVCFLLAPESGYVTGQVLHVDGGLTL